MADKSNPSLRDLYPDLSEKEFAEAEDNLDRYLALVLRIFERIEAESGPLASQLTPGTGTLPCTSLRPEAS
jgi:hypothetical protein